MDEILVHLDQVEVFLGMLLQGLMDYFGDGVEAYRTASKVITKYRSQNLLSGQGR